MRVEFPGTDPGWLADLHFLVVNVNCVRVRHYHRQFGASSQFCFRVVVALVRQFDFLKCLSVEDVPLFVFVDEVLNVAHCDVYLLLRWGAINHTSRVKTS